MSWCYLFIVVVFKYSWSQTGSTHSGRGLYANVHQSPLIGRGHVTPVDQWGRTPLHSYFPPTYACSLLHFPKKNTAIICKYMYEEPAVAFKLQGPEGPWSCPAPHGRYATRPAYISARQYKQDRHTYSDSIILKLYSRELSSNVDEINSQLILKPRKRECHKIQFGLTVSSPLWGYIIRCCYYNT